MSQPSGDFQPSRSDRLRPAEYVGGAAIAAIFVGVIALVTTRDWTIALVGAGGAFIVVLVVLALLQMAIKPDASEQAELGEHHSPDADGGPKGSAD